MKNNLREIRTKLGISQEKLSILSDVNLTTIRNIEKERTPNPTIETVIKIKRALQIIDIEELFLIDE